MSSFQVVKSTMLNIRPQVQKQLQEHEQKQTDYIPKIPNKVHFIYGLKEQNEPFTFMGFMAIFSAFIVHKPDEINFFYHHKPWGYWWERVQSFIKNLIQVEPVTHIGQKQIKKHEHQGDILRLQILQQHGGIYMDIDTISVTPYTQYLSGHSMVMGLEYDYGLCNAVMMSEPNSKFIEKWLQQYEQYFQPDGWNECSVMLPYRMYKEDSQHITVLPKEAFFYPGCQEVHDIFQTTPAPNVSDQLMILHLWNGMHKKFCDFMGPDILLHHPDVLYSKLVFNVLITADENERKYFENVIALFLGEPSVRFNRLITYDKFDVNKENTTNEHASLIQMIDALSDVKTVVDFGCGMCTWIQKTKGWNELTTYTGIDCLFRFIESNRFSSKLVF